MLIKTVMISYVTFQKMYSILDALLDADFSIICIEAHWSANKTEPLGKTHPDALTLTRYFKANIFITTKQILYR